MILLASFFAEGNRKRHRRILVMDHGRLVQDGTHAELLSSPGPYARMFRAQAAWYRREDIDEG